uniref:Trafficking protein particle complex subunit 8 n=3 Tax=Cacopsylla melanoneura TaxID=428564 RepID=A0A8D8PUA0_9HEMI
MAKTKQSAKEFIQSTFPPMLAVMASPLANEICLRNKLSFTELLQPFSKVQMEIHVREPSGTVAVLKELKLSISEWTTRPPQSMLARKFLNESVSQVTSNPTKITKVGNRSIEVPIATPWFESWRETFLKVQFPLDHEFTRHYLACFIGVSASEDNLTGTLTFMNQELSQSINANVNLANLPKWFGLTICKYYVMIHDSSTVDPNVARTSFDTLKTFHGESNCFLLSINSQHLDPTKVGPGAELWAPYVARRSNNPEEQTDVSSDQKPVHIDVAQDAVSTIIHPLSPEVDSINFNQSMGVSTDNKDQHLDQNNVRFGELLSSDDVIRIKQLMKDFVNKALIPYVESEIHNLTEIIANKKGVSRTLFSTTKRWFGMSKPGAQSPGAAPPPTSVVYSHDSQELQLRRLGDLCFMFGLYSLAFQAYHSAKRDFGADNAWLYYAGALEMASLSAYLANIETRKAMEYLEESINCYLNHCKIPQFATRATLLSFEFLKDIGSYAEAARQLVRMTSEESDLRSALLLEQAAYCYLYAASNLGRKYAFHLVLAGHRYSKAKQRKHSLRCYRQAYQVYENSGWSAATDHIHLTIGKHTASLQQLEESVASMTKLLGPSKQTPVQQEMYLRDYILTLQQLNKTSPHVDLSLPIPLVNQVTLEVLLGTPIDPEKHLGTPASGVQFNETKERTKRWNKLEEELVSVGNPKEALVFKPLVCLFNGNSCSNSSNLPVAVVREKICVKVELRNPMNISIHMKHFTLEINSTDVTVEHLPLTDLTLAPDCNTEITLSFVPQSPGIVNIVGINYQLCSSNRDDMISIGGSQKFSPSPHPLLVQVIESAPCLQVYFRNLHSTVLAQECQELRLVLKNLGSTPLHRLLLASPTPSLFSLSSSSPSLSRNVTQVPLPTSLGPGASYILPLRLQAPPEPGPVDVDLLFYYDVEPTGQLKYRVLRHTFHLTVLSSVHCSVLATRSCASSHSVNLRLQVNNTTQVNNVASSSIICLEHICLSSSHWRLKPSILPSERVRLDRAEVYHTHLQAEQCASPTPSLTHIDLTGEGAPSTPTPFLSFLTNERDDEGEEGSSALNDVTSFRADLVVRWKVSLSSREALGYHILHLTHLDETVSFPSSPLLLHPLPSSPVRLFSHKQGREENKAGDSSARNLARYFLRYETRVEHDFTRNKLAVVPIEACIENYSSTSLELKFKTNIDKPSNIRSQLYNPQCLHSFRLTGVCQFSLTLGPGQSHLLQLSAVFTRPGTYDLQSRMQLVATTSSDPNNFVTQEMKTDSILILSETSES